MELQSAQELFNLSQLVLEQDKESFSANIWESTFWLFANEKYIYKSNVLCLMADVRISETKTVYRKLTCTYYFFIIWYTGNIFFHIQINKMNISKKNNVYVRTKFYVWFKAIWKKYSKNVFLEKRIKIK